MKKHCYERNPILNRIILSLCFFCIPFQWVNAQINLSTNRTKLETVIEKIKSQSKYSFFYNDSLRGIQVNAVNAQNVPINTLLNKLFKGTGITYRISRDVIYLTYKAEKQNAKQEQKTQQGPHTVSGVVTDAQGEPLIGVSVIDKTTGQGVVTDINGHYTFTTQSANPAIEFSYIGYSPQTVHPGNRSSIDIKMAEEGQNLNEVVVTALGIKREDKALSYNVQKLKSDQLLTVKEASVANALSGKIAGITVSQGASGIGGSTKVVMRGDKSVNPEGNNNALYVLDGIPLPDLFPKRASSSNGRFGGVDEGDGISGINMEDIAEVTVLTGPSAAALYGGQAANGVVMLTSKQGGLKDGKPRITFSHYTDLYRPFILPKLQNSYGSRTGEFSSWGPKLQDPASFDPADFFDTGSSFSNSVGLQFGNDKNKSYISLAAYNAHGIIHNNKLNRYNVTYNGMYSITDKLSLGATFMYVNKKTQNMLSQGEYYNPIVPLYLFPRGDNIEKYKSYERYNASRGFATQFWPYEDQKRSLQNPYWITHRNFNINQDERIIMGGTLKYTITNWLNISARFRTDRNTKVNEIKNHASTLLLLTSGSDKGSYLRAADKSVQDYGDIIASFNKNFSQLGVVINAGGSFKNSSFNYTANSNKLEFGAPLASVPNKFTLNNLTPEPQYQEGKAMKSQALFVSASFDYKRMLFLDLTGRNEWTSLLANTNSKSIFYPSAGLSFIWTELVKVPKSILTFSKLRLSYAKVGNVPLYLAGITIPSYPISPGGGVSINPDLPINNLKFERTKSFEIGLSSRFLNNKLGLDITYYNANTFDQLFKFRAQDNSGYRYFYVNAGKVNNQGVEASLDADLSFGNVQYSPMFTFTCNRNKIVELVQNIPNPFTGKPMNVSHFDMGGLSSFRNYINEGGSVGDIYVNSFVKDGNGYVYVNPNTQQMLVNNENLIYAGNTNPDCIIGFNNTFKYKGFTLSFLVDARIGGKVVSSTQAVLDSFGASEQSAKARDNGGVYVNGILMDAETYYKQVGGGSGVLSNYVYSATNIRLREASLSYKFGKPLFGNTIKDLTISVNARNLWMIYNKAPFDPQLTSSVGTYYQGIDYFLMPSLRSFGLNVRFAL
ncbi:SusC/RagA family TonB-linked outer membrane protein [Prevotella sp.]|uniref:SusC/RagA family TonB-linked outer membrane protein n=1 Tax=Prevotella sp. TaxID=59823 RepID=UPI002F94F2E4